MRKPPPNWHWVITMRMVSRWETSCLHMQQKLHFLETHPISKKRFMRQGPDLIFTAST
jgi:hypothetical protein